MLERRWENEFRLGGDPSIAIRLSHVKDDVERGRMAAALGALGEPEVERLSLPKFGTWNARGGAGGVRFGYWPILMFCEEKGP